MSINDLWALPVNERPRQKILEVLKLEPFLTIAQVAALFYEVRRDGQPAKAPKFKPAPHREVRELPRGYHSARPILNRMVKAGQLTVFTKRGDDISPSLPNLYALKGTKKPINDRALYGHEMDVVNCFVALRKAYGPKLVRWQRRWTDEEYEYLGKKWKLWPDAVFEIEGSDQVYFLEVDRGTEEADQVLDKLARYIEFSNAHPKERFTVLFTAEAYRHDSEAMDRAKKLLAMFAKFKRGDQFIVTRQEDFLKDPDGLIWYSPKTTMFAVDKRANRPDRVTVSALGNLYRFLAL